mgnify:CR=1 FL=1
MIKLMHEHLQTQPFSFDRTFPVPDREPSRQYRRKTDPAKLSDEIDILQREIAMLEESHAKELACARSEAFEAGRHHVLADREAAILSALDAMQASMEEISEKYCELRTEIVSDATQLAFAAAEAIAGHAIANLPGGAIDEAIGRALAQVTRGQEIEVKVHPDLLDEIGRLVGVDEQQLDGVVDLRRPQERLLHMAIPRRHARKVPKLFKVTFTERC